MRRSRVRASTVVAASPGNCMGASLTGVCLYRCMRFTVQAPLEPRDGCHRVQCRTQSDHGIASTSVPHADLVVAGHEHVTWYASSERVHRGLRSIRGAVLAGTLERDCSSVAMGAFDRATRIGLALRIFESGNDHHYRIEDGVPQNPR